MGFHNVSGLFSSPSIPSPPPLPPAPNPDTDPGTADKLNEAERKRRQAEASASGRASTILTGGLGDTSEAPIARNVLLGA